MNIDQKFRKYILTATIMAPMTFIMATVGVLRNYGWRDGFVLKQFTTWFTMFPIAYIAALIVIPLANKSVSRIKFTE